MAGKLDRAFGAFCIALAGFLVVATGSTLAGASDDAGLAGLSRTASIVTLVLALVAAIPGIWLLFRGRTV